MNFKTAAQKASQTTDFIFKQIANVKSNTPGQMLFIDYMMNRIELNKKKPEQCDKVRSLQERFRTNASNTGPFSGFMAGIIIGMDKVPSPEPEPETGSGPTPEI